ncbi:hypothetical protein ABZ085_26890, partial [Streptomyces albidoflavus]|uniref:hypothetical protein n=1 Tax=Streptomyces albidoflavus TaxID=1886 RepID=UPI0033A99811
MLEPEEQGEGQHAQELVARAGRGLTGDGNGLGRGRAPFAGVGRGLGHRAQAHGELEQTPGTVRRVGGGDPVPGGGDR